LASPSRTADSPWRTHPGKVNRSLELDHEVADTDSTMRYDVEPLDLTEAGSTDEGDLSFAAFSLAHAPCGDDVLEVRIGEHTLLEWCMACAVMKIFGPHEM
jgi:hypothetical protein